MQVLDQQVYRSPLLDPHSGTVTLRKLLAGKQLFLTEWETASPSHVLLVSLRLSAR